MKYLALLLLLIATSALAANPVDTCNSGPYGLCTLPCGTVGTSPVELLKVNERRVELIIVNTGTTTIYAILGRGIGGYDYTYGIPIPPVTGGNPVLDLQVEPEQPQHTWTSEVSVATQSGSGACVYGERAN